MASRPGNRREDLLAQQAVLAEFGEFALRTDDLDSVLGEACRLAGCALGTDLSASSLRQLIRGLPAHWDLMAGNARQEPRTSRQPPL
jgi:hypothetical protein